ncbi:hypothetical protein FB567DRAFT_539483 [Paraphoma chrysanthemicola]|uniref:N-acetyltransferase domain-containing protein n=1 Tax=Paraphoma chrysanthemicola TaxID=798071 RepID=A0A8K0VSZ1_9PLEO|nr:hypothetical protein FB567DRAFT_539483 [Paraphoma chrysanthemicola]
MPPSSDIHITVALELYHEAPTDSPWAYTIHATAQPINTTTSPPPAAPIGSATAYIIDRFFMGEAGINFEDMDELSATTGEIIYDAIFFDDVTMEPFSVFHEVVVGTAWRRRGVGRDLVKAIHDKVHAHFGHGSYAFGAPGHLGAEVEREAQQQGLSWFRAADEDQMFEIQGRQLDAARAFWGKMGYKKMGESKFWEVLVGGGVGDF